VNSRETSFCTFAIPLIYAIPNFKKNRQYCSNFILANLTIIIFMVIF
jgi:hypothetical protein